MELLGYQLTDFQFNFLMGLYFYANIVFFTACVLFPELGRQVFPESWYKPFDKFVAWRKTRKNKNEQS